MNKRSHSTISGVGERAIDDGTTETSRAPKRVKGAPQTRSDAVALLRQHSKDLIRCLESLSGSDELESDGVDRLVTLSATLLPAFRTLSEETSLQRAETGATSASNDASGEGSEEPSTAQPALNKTKGPIPPLGSMTAWDVADIPKTFPPLPPILDPVLERAALTHKGMVLRPGDLSYEVLELLGDAFIYHTASEFITQTFRHLPPGRCSQMRERLLRNSNLSQYSLHYGLDKRASFPDEFFGQGRNGGTRATDKEREKVLGDIFESYVGALIHADPHGVSRAVGWLKPLWAMTLADDIRGGQSAQQEPERSPREQLNYLIGCKSVSIRYEDVPKNAKDNKTGLPIFTVAVHVDGWGRSDFLGSGSALRKKEAASVAAQQALKNKRTLKFYIEKKKAYLAAQEASKNGGT